MDKNQNTPTSNGVAIAKIDPKQPATDAKTFKNYLDRCLPQIQAVAASHLKPTRVVKIVLSAVLRTPALKACSMASILDAVMKAAEMGLEPGSATGEAYLVPYGKVCTLIPGYRGLISLAYRSGFVISVKAQVVYQGDLFEYEEGIHPKLRHVPNFEAKREPKDITFAFVVIQLRDGGLVYDVMTRGEIDAIRQRSKAGGNGPWVTDYAEMAKKTVTRRGLKYAPMSIEMSKALALDAVESGEIDPSEIAEFDYMDVDLETGEVTKTDKLKDKLGVGSEAIATIDARAIEKLTTVIGLTGPEIGDFQAWCLERNIVWTERTLDEGVTDKDRLYAEQAALV